MIKLTKKDLSTIFSNTKQNFVDMDAQGLDNQEFLTQCWVKAVVTFLQLNLNIDFPTREAHEPEDY